MVKVIGGAQEGEFKAVASGTLPNGKPVVVNADGTVSVAAISNFTQAVGSTTTFDTLSSGDGFSATYDTANNKVIIVYRDTAVSNRLAAVVGTVNGETITFGSVRTSGATGTSEYAVAYDEANQKVVAVYRGSSNYGWAVVGTVSGNSISFGTAVAFNSALTQSKSITYDPVNEVMVISYRDGGQSNRGESVVGTVSGTSISFGTAVTFNNASTNNISSCFDTAAGKVVVAYEDEGNGQELTAIVGTVSGTSISFGSEVVGFPNYSISNVSAAYDEVNQKVVIVFAFGSSNGVGTAVVGTVSGTAISFGSSVAFSGTDDVASPRITYNAAAEKMVIMFRNADNSNRGDVVVGTVSGTSISFGTPVNFEAGNVNANPAAVYDSNAKRTVFAFQDTGDANRAKATVFRTAYTSINLTSENYIGMSSGAAELENVGSPVTFESGATSYSVNTYDSNADRMVVAYSDAGDSGKGKVAVGTVSGDTTSFGTPVDFTNYQIQQARIVFDSNSNKIVIAWIKSSDNAGMSIVGTVDPSDNSISFGSEVQFEAGLAHMSLGFDSTNNKIISAFADLSDNNHGYAIVGTVSGTSISFGSISKFEAENTRHTDIAHDPDAGKTVIAYMDQGNSSYGTAVVSTVSGTSISFGTPVVYESATTNDNSVVYDTNSNKMIIAYSDGGNSSYGTAVVGTVSGTSISFGTPVVFHAAGYILQPICTFDAGSNKVVIVYMDNANDGRYVVGAVNGTSISFDASSLVESNATFSNESFWVSNIGLNKNSIVYRDDASSNVGRAVVLSLEQRGEVASGSSATVDIIGSLSTNQGSLTAGQQYFVQTDGTIGTTADSPSVLAGTAISSSKLLVKT